MEQIGKKAKIASFHLSNLNIDKRNAVLRQFSQTFVLLTVIDLHLPSACSSVPGRKWMPNRAYSAAQQEMEI